MKLPFYTVVGPILRRNQKSIRYFCRHPALSFSPFYTFILATLGVALSLFDIIRIIKCGPILPTFLWRERMKNGKVVAPEVERDFKLICLVLSAEYYLFLLVGLTTGNPIFFLPFMFLYGAIILMESSIFFITAFTEGMDFHKSSLVMSMFMVYNWLSVFCTCCRYVTGCDV